MCAWRLQINKDWKTQLGDTTEFMSGPGFRPKTGNEQDDDLFRTAFAAKYSVALRKHPTVSHINSLQAHTYPAFSHFYPTFHTCPTVSHIPCIFTNNLNFQIYPTVSNFYPALSHFCPAFLNLHPAFSHFYPTVSDFYHALSHFCPALPHKVFTNHVGFVSIIRSLRTMFPHVIIIPM